MGGQMVADLDQTFGLAVTRMIRDGCTGRAQSTPVRRSVAWAGRHGPSELDGAGAVPHVFIVIGGGTSRSCRLRRPLVGQQLFMLLVHAEYRIAHPEKEASDVET